MNHVTYRSACSLKAGLSWWAVTSQTRSPAQAAASPAAVSTGLHSNRTESSAAQLSVAAPEPPGLLRVQVQHGVDGGPQDGLQVEHTGQEHRAPHRGLAGGGEGGPPAWGGQHGRDQLRK